MAFLISNFFQGKYNPYLNTADFYGSGESEMLIGEAINGRDRDKVFISVKFEALVAPNGSMYGLDVRPLTIKNYLTHSLKRLNLDYIDLYQPGRIDQGIPIEETIGAISEIVKAGYVKHIGITTEFIKMIFSERSQNILFD